MSRCDLHIHSRFSARSEEWLFRRFDLPDSYSDPRNLHRLLRERGMDFVTITDHDTIEGSLAIADMDRTFISEEVTTYFPTDPCKHWEEISALGDALLSVLARQFLSALPPEKMEKMANRHNLLPTHAEPWQ